MKRRSTYQRRTEPARASETMLIGILATAMVVVIVVIAIAYLVLIF